MPTEEEGFILEDDECLFLELLEPFEEAIEALDEFIEAFEELCWTLDVCFIFCFVLCFTKRGEARGVLNSLSDSELEE